MNEKETISLKAYFVSLLKERDKRIYQRFKSMEKAFTEFKQTTEKRFENANEWRNSYDDLVRTYIPRTEFTMLEKELEKIKNVKQGGNQAWIVLVAGAGILLGYLTLIAKLFIK